MDELDNAENPDDIVSIIRYLLDKFIHDENVPVRLLAARDQNLTLEQQKVLANDYNEQVRNALLKNPCLHESIRNHMLSVSPESH